MIELLAIIVSIAALLLLIAARVPVAAALLLVGIGGISYIQTFDRAMVTLTNVPYAFATSWTLSALPMYLIMGHLAHKSGMAEKIYDFARLALHRIPGSLAVTSIFACAGFGAISGSAAATTATFSKLAIPEMLRDKYDKSLAAGSVAASGTMGSLMPPSVLMIVYAGLAEISAGRCFIAGIIPCLLSAAIYAAMVILRVKRNPALAPIPTLAINVTGTMLWQTFWRMWDVLLLIVIIFGGIYSGFVTATEAGALGAFASLIIGVATHRVNLKQVVESIYEGVKSTCLILMIGVGANIFVRFLAFAGIHDYLADTLAHFSPLAFLSLMFFVYILLGMFLDPIGMMLLTVPVLTPVLDDIGIDLVWYCILVIKCTELGNITPPVGLTVYIVKGVVGESISVEKIFKGIGWFACMDVLTFWILALFPWLSLVLPRLILGS